METRLKYLKQGTKKQSMKSVQLKKFGEIWDEIDGVKIDKWKSNGDNTLNLNTFEGMLGANVSFVGNATLTVNDSGYFERTEIELRKILGGSNNYQSLGHIYKTACLDDDQYRKQTAPQGLFYTFETPGYSLNDNQQKKTTSFMAKGAIWEFKHIGQESFNGFIDNLYETINHSINEVALNSANSVAGNGKEL